VSDLVQIGQSFRNLSGQNVQFITMPHEQWTGNANRVQEYDSAGRVVWEIQGDPGYIFRAERIASLYAPGVGTPR